MRLLLLLALSLFIHQTAAWAEEPAYSKKFNLCLEQSAGANGRVLDCIMDEAASQDARLNRAYKKLMAQLPPERQTALKEAQRAWIKFRDLFADFFDDKDGGTMSAINRADWILTSTASQAKILEGELEK